MSNAHYPDECPLCRMPAYIRFGHQGAECSNRKCENYVEPKEASQEASPPSERGSTGSSVNPWGIPFVSTGQGGAHPSASPSGGGKAGTDDYDGDEETDPFAGLDIDWATVQLGCTARLTPWVVAHTGELCVPSHLLEEASRRQKAAGANAQHSRTSVGILSQSAKPVTPNSSLKEVHDSLTEEEKSQLQPLFRSLLSTRSHLEAVVETVAQASGNPSKYFQDSCLSDMPSFLSDLRAKLPELEGSLEQLDQFLHRLQSGDQHSSGNHKSEDTCQTGTAQCRVCSASLSKCTVTGFYPKVCSFACGNNLASTASKSQSQSCETQYHERWEDFESHTFFSYNQGFQKGLYLLGFGEVGQKDQGLVVGILPPARRRFHLNFPDKHLYIANGHYRTVREIYEYLTKTYNDT